VIVVDCNVLAYFLLPHDRYTTHAERLYSRDPAWYAPPLWRSELRNILLKHMRHRGLSCRLAIEHMSSAEAVLSGRTLSVGTESVLRIAENQGVARMMPNT
jgi:predicted nucleic acid-binding protein